MFLENICQKNKQKKTKKKTKKNDRLLYGVKKVLMWKIKILLDGQIFVRKEACSDMLI